MISRKDRRERVSVSHISVARSLLSTSASQRGCVSQTISAVGNDSRRPATAGKVWTMSPRDPRRTTRKRCSGMRRLANRLYKFASGVILGVANNRHSDAEPDGNGAFRHGVGGVVGAFGVNIGAKLFQEGFHVGVIEEHGGIHASKRGHEQLTCVLIKGWTNGRLQ